MNLIALIMAGGSGERFGAGMPKQLVMLRGKPVLAWSAALFARSPRVAGILVVGPAADEEKVRAALPTEVVVKMRGFVPGGATRQESVFAGLEALPKGTTHVLIHDAARPCTSEELRDRVIKALGEHNAVIPTIPATDTLMHVRAGSVESVVDRGSIARVQTPQGFLRDLIIKAHQSARTRGFSSSDDGSLVLAMGEPVATVEGERSNIKVTYRDDIAVAEAILKRGVSA